MKNNTTLHLVLTHYWFDKIVSGAKTSEYRECSEYWNKRLQNNKYDTVVFHRGYTNTIATYNIVAIAITTEQNDLELPRCWKVDFRTP